MTTLLRLGACGEAHGIGSWLNRHAVWMLAAGLVAAATEAGMWVTLAAASSLGTLWLRQRPGGTANRLTAARLTLVLLAAAALTKLPHAWLLGLFAANVVIDIADGIVARRLREATPFGAVFDREADAVFVLVVYLYFLLTTDVGAWVVALGLLPYVYRLLAAALPVPIAPDHKEPVAGVLAGVNFLLLLVALLVPERAPQLLVGSAVLVLASFSLSFWSLYRHARPVSQ
jgi:phosphatidylglycerophosphate synthase